MRRPAHFQTDCIHRFEEWERFEGAVAPPLFQNSLFAFPDCETLEATFSGQIKRYSYSRGPNPTVELAEQKIATLEGGEAARCFGSGMAAISAALLSSVRAGDHILAVTNCYAPTIKLLDRYLPRYNITTTFVTALDVAELDAARRATTRVLYLESPTSLTFRLQDIALLSHWAREREITTIVDNSWATPYFQRPLALGADLVVHSASKYLGGHSDLLAGVVVGSATRLRSITSFEFSLLGGTLGPFEAWLILRALRTLGIRMEHHFTSTVAVAKFLASHPKVVQVHYPYLPTHPQFALAQKQMSGGSGLMSFQLQSDAPGVRRFINALELYAIAVSWGGYDSLVLPVGLTHFRERPSAPGITPGLIRLHIGLEDTEDLQADLEQALQQV